jgi:protease I
MSLEGKKIALIATDGFEDSELTAPLEAVKDAGADVSIISIKSGEITGENGTKITVDNTIDNTTADQYDALLIPGGVKNPDTMRTVKSAVTFVKDFFDQHKPVAAICHGPWMLVEAGVLHGRKLTSWPSLKTDIMNADGNWVDEEVIVDEGLVTSRKPDDLKVFCAKIIEEFSEGKHQAQTA